jgi:hypothetical protein
LFMKIDFSDPATTLLSNQASFLKKLTVLSRDGKLLERIPTSADVTGIELRMLPPFIKDNRTPAIFPFPGYARLYCLTIVVSDVDNQLAGNIDLKGFQRIGDRENLPINKTIFYWQSQKRTDKAPTQIHSMCSVIKSKKDLRDVGEILTSVKSDDNYKSLIGTLKNLAKDATQLGVVTDILTQVAGIVGTYLGRVEDKPLGTVINSYTTLHGDFDKPGVNALAYPTRNVDFDFQLVIRNAAAEKGLSASKTRSAAKKESRQPAGSAAQAEEVLVDMVPL